MVVFEAVYDTHSIQKFILDFLDKQHSLDDGMMDAGHDFKAGLATIYTTMKEARRLRFCPMENALVIELVRIIQAGKSLVTFVRKVFGKSSKNLGAWLTRVDRESRLMQRILGEDYQVSIRDWAENVRDWRRCYDGLKWSVYVNRRG